MIVGSHGRAKAGPYTNIRPAEAGAGRYRCPACQAGLAARISSIPDRAWGGRIKKSKIISGSVHEYTAR